MKRYRVMFASEALEEALAAAAYIASDAPTTAASWYEGLQQAIDSLGSFPRRCPVAPESEFLGHELRHLTYKSHRIIFRIEQDARVVRVLHIRHAKQQAIGEPARPPDADLPPHA
jgi:plasmid stabilization system protein ParE